MSYFILKRFSIKLYNLKSPKTNHILTKGLKKVQIRFIFHMHGNKMLTTIFIYLSILNEIQITTNHIVENTRKCCLLNEIYDII